MKIYLIILPLFFHSTGIAQDDFYVLIKNGERYSKPIYNLSENDFEIIKKIDNNKIVFISQKNRFIYNPEKHDSYELEKEKVKEIKLVKPESLYKYEEHEFNKRANEIKKESGFKPLPPIKHHILKILILRKIKNCYFLFEVNWLNS